MDQHSFRLLLQSSGGSSTPQKNGSSTPRGNLLSSGASTKSKKVDATQPTFKPRKVKKASAESKYRDRAAERREGGGNDYAHVEAILEDFERRNAKNEDKKVVEEQRKYLGGDGEHSILVKGLDLALLEQNKARAALDTAEDDDTLEKAYLEVSSTVPQKRTRADIINELKRKHAGEASTEKDSEDKSKSQVEEKSLDEVKKRGKFKPIGFKPIGGSGEGEKKKKKPRDDTKKEGGEEKKKKKRKVEGATIRPDDKIETTPATAKQAPAPVVTTASASRVIPESEPEPPKDDFDIFADVDDYEGIDLGADDEVEDEAGARSPLPSEPRDTSSKPTTVTGSRGWFVTEGEDELPSGSSKPPKEHTKHETRSVSPGRRRLDEVTKNSEQREIEEVEEEEEKAIRLQPLESSALPSIRDFLAMDEAAEVAEKRRKRKEKKHNAGGGGGGGGKSIEEKVNRDFQRLQSYTSKKEAPGTR